MIEIDKICDRIQELFEERGADYSKSYEQFGVSPETLKTMFIKRTIPRFQTICKICESLEISMYEFFKEEKPADIHIEYTSETSRMLELYRRFTPEWQKKLLEICQKFAEVRKI